MKKLILILIIIALIPIIYAIAIHQPDSECILKKDALSKQIDVAITTNAKLVQDIKSMDNEYIDKIANVKQLRFRLNKNEPILITSGIRGFRIQDIDLKNTGDYIHFIDSDNKTIGKLTIIVNQIPSIGTTIDSYDPTLMLNEVVLGEITPFVNGYNIIDYYAAWDLNQIISNVRYSAQGTPEINISKQTSKNIVPVILVPLIDMHIEIMTFKCTTSLNDIKTSNFQC